MERMEGQWGGGAITSCCDVVRKDHSWGQSLSLQVRAEGCDAAALREASVLPPLRALEGALEVTAAARQKN